MSQSTQRSLRKLAQAKPDTAVEQKLLLIHETFETYSTSSWMIYVLLKKQKLFF